MPEKTFVWDEAKNAALKRARGVSFEDVIRAFAERGSLWIRDNPKPEKYPGQKLLAVLIDEYVYIAPYEETDEAVILKTIYPSRKATKEQRRIEEKNR